MDKLEINLLGPPEARWEGKLIQISRRITRMLLFYLAGRGRMVTRIELISILWENLSESEGRLRLRETLNKLRSALPDPACLLTQSDLIGLNPEKVDVDLDRFNQIMEQLGAKPWVIPPEEPLPPAIELALRDAVRLWRSPHFMAGADILNTLAADQWFSTIVLQSEQIYFRIIQRLIDHEIVTGNYDSALYLVNLALARNDLEEKLHEQTIWLHLQLGNVQQARQHYLDYSKHLKEEMNLLPGPKLQEMFEQMQNKPIEVETRQRADWIIRPSAQIHFVGRKKYLALLTQAYQNGQNFILLGESGQGKTRLLQEFVDRLEPAPRVLLAQCRVTDQNLPLQPILDVMKSSVQEADWKQLAEPLLQVLVPIFPELTNLYPSLKKQTRLSPEQTRVHIFEILRQVFAILAAKAKLLFVIDDTQWADEGTLAALSYLVARPPFTEKGMVIIAARVEEERPGLRTLIKTVPPNTQVIHLGSLSPNEISEMADRVLGSPPPPTLTERLILDTGGNPFFILETLRAIQAQPSLLAEANYSGQQATLPLADRLLTFLQNRLSVLQPKTRELLDTAAVTGTEFSLGVVHLASGQTLEEAANALDELEERYLIEPVEQELPDVSYRFIHEKVREALLASLNPLQAQVMHKRVADAILAEQGEMAWQQAGALAYHYYSAGDWRAAFPWWVKAMDRSRQLLVYSDAVETLNFAEKVLERHFENLDDELIAQFYRTWSEIAQTASRFDEMQAAADKLLRLGERKRSALIQGAAYLVMTDLDLVRNQFDQGILHAKQAIACMKKTPPNISLWRAHTNLGMFQYLSNQFQEAISTLETVLANLPESSSLQGLILVAAVHYHLGLAYTLNGRPRLGYEHANQSLANNLTAQLLDGQVAAYSVLALAYYLSGKYPEARRASECGLEYTVRGQHKRLANYLRLYQAFVELAEGRLDAMHGYLTPILKYVSENRFDETLLSAYRVLGDTYLWMRDYASAIQYYEQSSRASGGHFLSIDHQLCYIIARQLNGERNGLDAQFDALLKECQDQGLESAATLARLGQVKVAIHAGAWQQAQEIALDLYETSRQNEIYSVSLHTAQLLAAIDVHFGRVQPAIDRLQSILISTREPLNAWLEVEILCTLNAARHQAGQSAESAQKRLRTALAQIQTNSTHPDFRPGLQNYLSEVNKAFSSFQSMPW